ncbi:MAG: signal recognition particle protein [Actinobacteria bacterium HGW-Actinobacteria-6]|jgi:signal recognition particle subunit SRP54|nr:MAG: signal recognition particle protein [Actinobacteria bacterium HGW-Actinobacteria-6]
MFQNLSDRLQDVFSRLTGRGKLSEADVDAAMREVRMALLEADVNFKVVKEFVAKVRERAVGADVMQSLTPGQMVVKIVLEELTALMGGNEARLALSGRVPNVIMLVGLQGAGKTTAVAKLANLLRKQGKRPLMVACDVYRPAAIDQLEALGRELDIPVYRGEGTDAVAIAKAGVRDAIDRLRDLVIIDTAGRLHIDEEMMSEAAAIKMAVKPEQVLMVVDAMTGQDAVNAASAFAERVNFDGVIISKLDGDARGGAALSIRAVTGKPVLFASVGEKTDNLEVFRPDGMARRILGMGDVVSLIEKAQEAFDEDTAVDTEERLRAGTFTLDDFLGQLRQLKKMGSIKDIMAMIPGANKLPKDAEIDEGALVRTEAIIQSMSAKERAKPSLINGSRRERIAKGAGVTVYDVNQMLKQFAAAQKMVKQMGAQQGKGKRRRRGLGMPGMPF